MFNNKPLVIVKENDNDIPLRNIYILNDNRSVTFDVNVFFPLSLPILLPNLTVYMSNRRVSYKKQELLPFAGT
jgi:hypothetical protein